MKTTKDLIKALKRSAREEFGFETTKISSNRKKYSRSHEKDAWRQQLAFI